MIDEKEYAKFFGWVPDSSATRQKSQVTNVTSYAHYFICCYAKTLIKKIHYWVIMMVLKSLTHIQAYTAVSLTFLQYCIFNHAQTDNE